VPVALDVPPSPASVPVALDVPPSPASVPVALDPQSVLDSWPEVDPDRAAPPPAPAPLPAWGSLEQPWTPNSPSEPELVATPESDPSLEGALKFDFMSSLAAPPRQEPVPPVDRSATGSPEAALAPEQAPEFPSEPEPALIDRVPSIYDVEPGPDSVSSSDDSVNAAETPAPDPDGSPMPHGTASAGAREEGADHGAPPEVNVPTEAPEAPRRPRFRWGRKKD
jgi:hypothetical protein